MRIVLGEGEVGVVVEIRQEKKIEDNKEGELEVSEILDFETEVRLGKEDSSNLTCMTKM